MPITLNGTTGIVTLGIQQWTSVNSSSTAIAGQCILADTSSGAITITLPATPSTNAVIQFSDKFGTWDTNNLTIARNGSTIEGLAEDLTCDVEGDAVLTLLYNGTTWKVYA